MNNSRVLLFGLAMLLMHSWSLADCQVIKPEGAVRYEGLCKDGLAHGSGRVWIPSRLDPNSYYTGMFVHGKLHGAVDYTFANGNRTIKDYFLEGREVGKPEYDSAAAAAAAAAKPSWEQAVSANTVGAYTQFIKDWAVAEKQVDQARDRIARLLEPVIREVEAAYKCEEARKLDEQFKPAGMSSRFNFDECARNRKFHQVLNSNNPQSMYLAGVKYENESERGRAKKVYLAIMDRFSEHAIAVKAADRLAGMNDVQAVEESNYRTQNAVRQAESETQRAIQKASRDAAYRNEQDKREFCHGKVGCFSSCRVMGGVLAGYIDENCLSACYSKYSMCN